jgi:lysophospholipase L1-like esterase
MVLRRWPAALRSEPDWILCGLGGNDVTRVGPEPTRPQVSLTESVANLRELRRIAAERTDAFWLWLTPTPVREELVAAFPGFHYGESTWRNADIVALADAVAAFPEPVADLRRRFGVPPDPDLLGPDGVHLSLAGQSAVAATVVEHLAKG